MERERALSLTPDRASAPGQEMTVRDIKQAVDNMLTDPAAASVLAELGARLHGAVLGTVLPAVSTVVPTGSTHSYAMFAVTSILRQQDGIQKTGPESAYSPHVLEVLERLGLNNPYGRTWVEVNAIVSGRSFEQVVLDWAGSRGDLLIEKKIEQIKGLAEAGRFDVLDPQFRDDPAFHPYIGLWDKVSPEVRAEIMNIQAEWAELARYWGAILAGERPAGPHPADPWGIGEVAMGRLERVTADELAQMKAELESGTATQESMAAFLERLDQRQEILGKEKIEALLAEVFGEKAAEVKGWLDFREAFVHGKAVYWHIRIEQGLDAAESWDRGYYQSLREQRDRGLQGEYAPLVAAIQAEAEALHNAYQRLHDAKAGWWEAHFQGKPTHAYEQEGRAAREDLARLDPEGAHWWNAERVWAVDREPRRILAEVREAYTAYWEALLRGDEAALAAAKARLAELERHGISPGAEPIRRIAEAYRPHVEAVYRENLVSIAEARSPAVLEHYTNWNAMLEREIGKEWAAILRGEIPTSRFGIKPGRAKSAEALEAKFDALGWTEMKPWAGLIWEVAEKYGVEAEIIAAIIRQESAGKSDAVAGSNAGHGLMQVEFSAWKDEIPWGVTTDSGAQSKQTNEEGDRGSAQPEQAQDERQGEQAQTTWTDDEKRAWLLNPRNNLEFAIGRIWKQTVIPRELHETTDARDELRRFFQYYNYGMGAARKVEEEFKEFGNWAMCVLRYGKGEYGDNTYWHKVMANYDLLMGREVVYVPLLKQGDSRWSTVEVTPGTYGTHGCTLTCIAMLLKYHNRNLEINKTFMEDLVKQVTDQNHDVVWYGKSTTAYLQSCGLQLDHESIKDWSEKEILKELLERLEQGQPVILGLGGERSHWVVVTGYIGTDRENLKLSDFIINDPGQDRMTLQQLVDDYSTSYYDALVTIKRS